MRDLSLIAAGLLIVSAIPLKAELDNLAIVRFAVALGGAVVVPYVVSRYVYRDRGDPLPVARRRPVDDLPVDRGSSACWSSAG